MLIIENIPTLVANCTVNNVTDQVDGNPFDIRVQKTLSTLDKKEVGLFNMLKVSNTLMILFDCIINGIDRYEAVITYNGTLEVMKRKMCVQDLNRKLKENQILTKETVG